MSKSKIKGKDTKIPSPFDPISYKTEWTATAILMYWMREIIKNKNLDLGLPDVETKGADKKRPDIIIYETRRSPKVLCVIEAKPPYFDIFDQELKRDAQEKANKRKAKYFCVTNFKQLIWYSTEKVNANLSEEEQIIDKYTLSNIENLDDIEQTRYKEPIKRALEKFITELYEVSTGKRAEPKLAIDEFLVFRLYEKINKLAKYYREIIEDQCHKDENFAQKIRDWFIEQGWSFAWQTQDFEKVARQTAYLLVNKILFYNVLQAKRTNELDPLEISEGLTKGSMLQKILQTYFSEVLKIDYESIYTTDFIDIIAFPDSKEVVEEIKDLINILKKYDFSKLGYDIIGRIFERLIPKDERHNLGQYFTNPDIVDLILGFCLQHENDIIFDPACGAGTFLVRAYHLKKLMNQYKTHDEILNTLWGVEIAKFPAHLATINLAINDLSSDKNYPNIIQADFFSLPAGGDGIDIEKWREITTKTLANTKRKIKYPKQFDAIVGNPPYTRQEEIPEIGVDKEKLIENALKDISGNKIANINKRAGIHAYFFVHGTKFLKDGGYFGFIVSNSWLDVEYGGGLQEFLLKNYKIIAIIESKVERWFEDADVNTCIIILQKCKNEKERNENFVRFVYLKKPLRYFIPSADETWESQIKRKNAIENFKRTIFAHNEYYENEDLRIYPKKQIELWEEGYDPEENKYVNAKWGKYLRAPEIFFKILEKGKDKFVPLKEVAEIRRGFTTGADPWFYVRDITNFVSLEDIKQLAKNMGYKDDIRKLKYIQSGDGTKWLIESQYLKPLIRDPSYYKKILIEVELVKDLVVFINEPRDKLKGKLVEKYILHGEKKKYKVGKGKNIIPAKTKTCKSRKYWYKLPDIKPSQILWQKEFDVTYRHYITNQEVFADQQFYLVYPKNYDDIHKIVAYFNSTLWCLFFECTLSAMGLGAIVSTVFDTKNFLIIDPSIISSDISTSLLKSLWLIGKREILPIWDELGVYAPEEVSLDKVKSDRRKLDKIIMGDILGLTEEEQLEVYKAVVDLVKSRIEKAKSVKKKNNIQKEEIQEIVIKIVDEINKEE